MSKRRTRNRSESRKKERQRSPFYDVPFEQEIRNLWPPYEIVTEAQIETLHDASMQILENTGMEFQYEPAMELWEKAGAKVDRKAQKVWPDRGLITELVAKAPSSFTFRARNPLRNRLIGGNSINFYPCAGMVFMHDLDRGRRPGTKADWIKIGKLAQASNAIHLAPIMAVVMHDVAVNEKHLQNYYLGATISDKPLLGISHGTVIPADVIEMARIVFGEELEPELGPVTGGVINVNSPLIYDDRMLGGMMTFAAAGQINVITPFILAGAMSPVTIAAALAQHNAEALAGIALTQLVRPGAPVVYGGFTTNVDMRSGAPAFGTPEGAWAHFIGAQLARHYGLPYRGSGGLNTSNVTDAQAMSESMWSLWPCILAHTNLVLHSAGWLESGLAVSPEKYVLDVENLAMMQHMLKGPSWTEADFALDAIHEVGPGGHNFGTAHTQERFETAFYPSFVNDRRNFGTWTDGGSEDATLRAHKLYKEIIQNFKKPPLDEGVHEGLLDFVQRRTKELEGVDLYD